MRTKITSSASFLLGFFLLSLTYCSPKEANIKGGYVKPNAPYAQLSQLANKAIGFDSPKAINALVEMENQYFNAYEDSVSPFYGTLWRESLEADSIGKTSYVRYRRLVDAADSMHCTIYAVKTLAAGMGEGFDKLEEAHRQIWGEREHAGWSIGYLLVRDWGWKAYSIIDTNSQEYNHCQKVFRSHKSYPVWRQPDIPLEAMYVLGEEDSLISELLRKHEFGWGFSDQGYHTWITRFETLKECNWLGAPGAEFAYPGTKPLFLRTAFLDYRDYYSHVLVVPPLLPTNP